MVYVFLAEGFEETEALVPVDILRRAGADVQTVGVGGKRVRGAHGIAVEADITENEAGEDALEMIVLPGGMPGTSNLEKSAAVQSKIDFAFEKGIWIAAICAAPSILGHKGLLKGKRAVCFPGYEKDLEQAVVEDAPVCVDGNVITAKGAGVAMAFGFTLVEKLKGRHRAEAIRESMQCVG